MTWDRFVNNADVARLLHWINAFELEAHWYMGWTTLACHRYISISIYVVWYTLILCIYLLSEFLMQKKMLLLLVKITVSVHWCNFRQWRFMLNCKLSSLHYIYLSQVFHYYISWMNTKTCEYRLNNILNLSISPALYLNYTWICLSKFWFFFFFFFYYVMVQLSRDQWVVNPADATLIRIARHSNLWLICNNAAIISWSRKDITKTQICLNQYLDKFGFQLLLAWESSHRMRVCCLSKKLLTVNSR